MAETDVEEITADGADEQGDAPDGSAPMDESASAARSSFGVDRPAYGGPRGPQRASGGGRRDGGRERGGYGRRRVCGFCMDNVQSIDYKDTTRLRRFLSERGKIEPRRKTGVCAKHQRWLTTALQRARQLALLPYTAEHVRFLGR